MYAYDATGQQQQYLPQPQYYPDHVTSTYYTEEAEAADEGHGRSNRKKREREIEQQLLNGNIDAAARQVGGLKEVRNTPQWNAHEYTAQQQKEAEIARQFKVHVAPGESLAGKITMPSKVASRKHQITSLVAQAAKTELSMLDARGHKHKTKVSAQPAGVRRL